MTRVSELVHRDEFPNVRRDFESSHPARRETPFRPAYPGVSADALTWLRAADTSWAAPRRRPAVPEPRVDHFAQALATTRTVRRLAAVYDALADEAEALLAELAALAPFAAQVQKAGVER